jgi:hypothetical protein
MTNADVQIVHTDCSPYHSMGTLWLCNQKINSYCPFALSYVYIFYCNNKKLHKYGN